MTGIVLAAQAWPNNAALMETVRDLGYITGTVLDPTFGRGNWWRNWRPDGLIAHDLKTDGVDFRNLPEATSSIDTVTFDPPYIAQGGRDTSTLADVEFLDRYGLDDVPSTTDAVTDLIEAGAREFHRVLRPDGILLLKCMNYVNGGRYRTAAYDALDRTRKVGFTLIDELVHLRRPGPQPKRPRQLTARRNYSMLFVLRRDRRPVDGGLFSRSGNATMESAR